MRRLRRSLFPFAPPQNRRVPCCCGLRPMCLLLRMIQKVHPITTMRDAHVICSSTRMGCPFEAFRAISKGSLLKQPEEIWNSRGRFLSNAFSWCNRVYAAARDHAGRRVGAGWRISLGVSVVLLRPTNDQARGRCRCFLRTVRPERRGQHDEAGQPVVCRSSCL